MPSLRVGLVTECIVEELVHTAGVPVHTEGGEALGAVRALRGVAAKVEVAGLALAELALELQGEALGVELGAAA